MASKRSLIWVVTCLVLVSMVDVTGAEARSKRRSRKARHRPVAAERAWLLSRSAIVLDSETGEALYEREPDRHMYPASTTKVLTAIVAIESGRLDEIVTVQLSDTQVQPSSVGLRPGERISLRDLVYCLMLRSGNDAALAIARHVGGGDRQAFYAAMNARARDLGCTGTNFVNPHGLPNKNHYTTARDLGRIMMCAMKDDEFRKITGTQRYISRSSTKKRVLVNKNRLLRMYPGATGGKPGYTRAAQQTLVASAQRSGRELVVVCLHSAGRGLWSDAAHLLDFGFKRLGLLAGGGALPASGSAAPNPAP